MSNERIGVGFIGAGSICESRHLPGLAKLPGVEVVAVCNRSAESSQRVAQKWNIPHVESDWRRLIARPEVDAVFIGTWPYMHREMCEAALDAGKHCFTQARMCMNLAEGKAMVAAAARHPELVNMICPPPTRMPFEPWIRQQLQSGALGELTLVRLTQAGGNNLDPTRITWREQVEHSGLQVLAMGIFAETLNAWVGPYESLTAQTSTPIAVKTPAGSAPVKIGIPQVVTITGKLACGALAVEHHFGLAADQTTPGNELVLWGTKGTIRYQFGGTIEYAPAGAALQPVDVPAALQRDWLVEADFINAVRAARAGKPWRVSPDFNEGLLYMRKVEAVHRSARAGAAVTLASL